MYKWVGYWFWFFFSFFFLLGDVVCTGVMYLKRDDAIDQEGADKRSSSCQHE